MLIAAKIVIWICAVIAFIAVIGDCVWLVHSPERKKMVNFFWLCLGGLVCVCLSVIANMCVNRFAYAHWLLRTVLDIAVCFTLCYLDFFQVWKWFDELAFGVKYPKKA